MEVMFVLLLYMNDNVKEYMSDKLMRSEQQLRRAEDNGCPPEIITILHKLTKQYICRVNRKRETLLEVFYCSSSFHSKT